MVLTVAPFYPRLTVLTTQLADLPGPESSHQAYQKSDWYGKIISFLLDGPTALDNLSPTKKKVVKQASVKYWVTDQQFFILKEVGRPLNIRFPIRSPLSLSGRMMSMGIFPISLHFIKYKASGIGQLELMMWSNFVEVVRPVNSMDLGELAPIFALFSVLDLGL